MPRLCFAMLGSLAICSALIGSARATTPEGWDYVGTDEEVVVYKKEIPGSDVVAFKGVTYADAPIARLLAVLKDPSQRPHWLDRYVEHKTFEKSGDSEVYWIHFSAPWPVSDRDFLLKADGKANPEKRIYTVEIKSVERKDKGDDPCCVRALLHGTYYEFTALPGEEKTKVVVEVHMDPRGSLPSWVVNLIQKSWPAKTLRGLVTRAKDPSIVPLPELADWHKKEPLPVTSGPAEAEAVPIEPPATP